MITAGLAFLALVILAVCAVVRSFDLNPHVRENEEKESACDYDS